MNQQQKRYAAKRINELKEKKLKITEEKHTTQPIRLTTFERAKLIHSGDVNMIPLPEKDPYSHSLSYLENLYDFSDHEKPYTFDREEFRKESDSIIAEATRIQDLLILGDASEAMVLIEEFSKF